MSNGNPFDTGDFDNPFGSTETYNPFTAEDNKKKSGHDDFYSSSSHNEPRNTSTQTQSNSFISLDDISIDRPKIVISSSDDKNDDDGEKPEPSRFSLDYYRQFFDLDTVEVLWRCARSLVPFKLDFIEFVRNKPDLYGPFWITTTLIFFFAASSNLSTFLRYYFHIDAGTWVYNFFVFTVGVGVIYTYVFAVPIPFWLYFKFFADVDVGLVQLWCIYGYAMMAYVPISLITTCPNHYVQWAFMGVGLFFSSVFLLINMWQALKERMGIALIVLAIMAAGQVGFAMSCQLIFYQFPNAFLPPVTLSPATFAPTSAPIQ